MSQSSSPFCTRCKKEYYTTTYLGAYLCTACAEQLKPEMKRGLKRNESCLCGSGKKFKNCCLKRHKEI